MRYRHLALTAALACAMFAQARAEEPRAVVELFTSQGCSSCPAADRLLGELSRDPSILTLSLPVDYWDYLGWKDTLALHGHAARQRAYAAARGDREVYTPQAVINGVVHVLGSDKAAIEQAIVRTRQGAAPLRVPVKLEVADGAVTVHLPAGGDGQAAGEVWLCPITGKVQVSIGRGENSGHTLTYYNVVRRWMKIGEWNGKAEDFSVPVSKLPNADFTLQDVDRVAVIVQRGATAAPGLVLGAATTSLH
jgi:hypothetical protein